MKTLHPFSLLFALILSLNSQAQKDSTHFVTTWVTTVLPYLDDSVITIHTDPNYNYNFDVDWNNDGVFDTLGVKGDVTHRYASFDTVTIRIRGKYPKIYWAPFSKSDIKLLSVNQWGTNYWKSMERAFNYCSNLQAVSITDTPRLDSVKNMASMFRYTPNFSDTIDHWDVSSVTDMGFMFSESKLNESINNWDVSSVQNMEGIFYGSQFNQPLNHWDVSSVTNMEHMFHYALNFNQAINQWDVSSVINMHGMFANADSFNQPINDWDVSSVTDMSFMFASADSFNQALNDWDVSSVTDMKSMFGNAESFNQPLNNWDVSSVTDMSYMFSAQHAHHPSYPFGTTGKSKYNSSLDGWDASSATTMHRMFYKNDSFNQAIGNWDVSSVTDMSEMFHEAEAFNQPIGNWDVSSVKNMELMFLHARSFDQPLDKWNVSSVIKMAGIFYNANTFNQNLMQWNIGKVKLIISFDSTAMSTANYDSTLISWQLKSHQSNIAFGAAGLTYCASDSARKLLIQDGWTFSGDSLNCTLVGIAEKNEKQAHFELYPNPSSGFVFLEVAENKRQFPLQIYNTNGSLLREIRLDQTQNRIDLSEFADGLYLFRHGRNSEKVLLKR